MTGGRFNPEMLILARESRAMTQQSLAQALGVSQGNVSKFENGFLEVSDSVLDCLPDVLGYTRDFFFLNTAVYGFGSSCFYHRKRVSMPVSELRVIQAKLNVFRIQSSVLLRDVAIDNETKFFRMDVEDYESPEAIAIELRRLWNMPVGPVRGLLSLIERAGGVVWKWSFGTKKLDAVSQKVPGFPPVFFVNADTPGDRLRFTAAHELGHLVMHQSPSPDMEREADAFASEFLMPSKEIGPSLRMLSMKELPSLKAYWKVSMASLIMKASNLEKISDRQARSLFTKLSQNGWRTKEPVEIPVENPTVLADAIDIHLTEHGFSLQQLASSVYLSREEEFRDYFLPKNSPQLRVFG